MELSLLLRFLSIELKYFFFLYTGICPLVLFCMKINSLIMESNHWHDLFQLIRLTCNFLLFHKTLVMPLTFLYGSHNIFTPVCNWFLGLKILAKAMPSRLCTCGFTPRHAYYLRTQFPQESDCVYCCVSGILLVVVHVCKKIPFTCNLIKGHSFIVNPFWHCHNYLVA